MTSTQTCTATPLLTPADAARRLAVSRAMIYKLVREGRLRALRIGRLPRITEADLNAYLAQV